MKNGLLSDLIRFALLWVYQRLGKIEELFARADRLSIGTTGNVTDIDEAVAEVEHLQPLNGFERWILKPYIEREKEFRQNSFEEAMDNVLGTEEDW